MIPLFLDVDGVLNVFPYTQHKGKWDDYETNPATVGNATYQMTISRKCCDALSSLPLNIFWLTTWGDDANNKLSSMTGFEEFPVLARMPFSNRSHWKINAVENWYSSSEGQRRFIWIDDDAIPMWAGKDFPDALLIRTYQSEGITPDHIRQIKDYCEET